MKDDSPCHFCTDRKLGCHGKDKCERNEIWQKKHAEELEKIRNARSTTRNVDDYMREHAIKTKKRLNKTKGK